jgi:cytochrome c-type biogenesis protein CcmE
MKPKRQRMILVGASLLMLGGAAALALTAIGERKQYFRSPHQLAQSPVPAGQAFRLGGLVEVGSVKKQGVELSFVVTDFQKNQAVQFRGITPDLFREGQGVIAEGKLNNDGVFVASSLLAKHDENYMPPEVAQALKKSGQWKPYGTAP